MKIKIYICYKNKFKLNKYMNNLLKKQKQNQ